MNRVEKFCLFVLSFEYLFHWHVVRLTGTMSLHYTKERLAFVKYFIREFLKHQFVWHTPSARPAFDNKVVGLRDAIECCTEQISAQVIVIRPATMGKTGTVSL